MKLFSNSSSFAFSLDFTIGFFFFFNYCNFGWWAFIEICSIAFALEGTLLNFPSNLHLDFNLLWSTFGVAILLLLGSDLLLFIFSLLLLLFSFFGNNYIAIRLGIFFCGRYFFCFPIDGVLFSNNLWL